MTQAHEHCSEDDAAFFDAYGDWQPLSPAELTHLLRGFGHPWWLVGGYAIAAFTGVSRPHDDIDVSFFADAVPDFVRQLAGRYHAWSNHNATFRLFDDAHPEPLHPLAQIWVRQNARSPWVLDAIPSPSIDGKWQSKRNADHVAELDDVTWVAADGVRYLNAEIVLLFKARHNRPKDRLDFDRARPLLSAEKQAWLVEEISKLDPQHPWLAALG